MTISKQLLALTRQLLPSGRAFRIGYGSVNEAVEKGIIRSEVTLYNDGLSVLDTILPDNANFTTEDATRWEQRLGLITNETVPLEDRKAAIIRKMQHPGSILARQSAGYIQDQLRLAGFDVYVYENIPETNTGDILGSLIGIGEMGELEMGELEMGLPEVYYPDLFTVAEMGEIEMGGSEMAMVQYNNLVVNNINEIDDNQFIISPNYKCCFYVGGATLGSFANVLDSRKDEFRQLILKLKPTQTVGILFINYV